MGKNAQVVLLVLRQKKKFPMLGRRLIFQTLACILIEVGAALSCRPSAAAEFTRSCIPSKINPSRENCVVQMSGTIRAGDANRLERFLSRSENRDLVNAGWIVLDSLGGDVEEAIRLAGILHRWAATAVNKAGTRTTICASACFLVWVSAAQRFLIVNNGGIGLHRPSFSDDVYGNLPSESLARIQSKAMGQLREFLQGENIPQHLIDEMMRRPSNDVYWLTPIDFEEIGELSPWFEEVVVRECKYDRMLMRRLTEMINRGQISNEEAHRREEPQMTCVRNSLDARKAAFAQSLVRR
jgi:hypothetical protein